MRGLANRYNAAARIWLAGAGAALLLPSSQRLGFWLPLHLALAGAVSVAIRGTMMSFASALTAAPGPGRSLTGAQFGLINAGVAFIALGYPNGSGALVAIGGACFVVAISLVLFAVAAAWRRGLNHRHPLPMVMYAVAACAVLAGGTLGALLGSGAVHGPSFAAIRDTHLALNVLGWASVTIVATLITLLPTVLRIRIPRWNAPAAAACMVAGVALLAGGLATRSRPVSAAGALTLFAAGIQVAVMVARAISGPRTWPVPVTAKHMACAVAWFVCGGPALALACARGTFDAFVPLLEVIYVCGWVLQTLVGSWLYLVPVGRPGGPGERRVWFTATEVGANTQVIVANAGLALLALSVAGVLPSTVGAVGAWAALLVAAAALLKSWTFPALARLPAVRRRSFERWGA